MNVELQGIHKYFGKVHANDDITLKIPSGTIQGILGENGAGKSTLMKVLSGFIQADSGEIRLDGEPVQIKSPADAIHHGIGMLHQDPLDFPPLKVVDNFIVGSQGNLFPDRKKVANELVDLQKQFNFSLDPNAYVDTLTVGERQQLEILRLLWLGAKVLILDEPTTGINALQKVKLFDTLRLLAKQGKTIIFVSHKLEDVEVLCDSVIVLRRGQLVGSAKPPYDLENLITMMFGKVVTLGEHVAGTPGDPIIELEKLCIDDYRLKINDADVTVHAGEVIGLAGMEGSGQLLFMRACAGFLRPAGGTVLLKGKDYTGKNFHAFMNQGVAYIPASRMEEGLIPGLTLTEHFALTEDNHRFFIDWEKSQEITKTRIAQFNIRGTPNSMVEALSGGNQQRALLALMKTPLSLILMEHPTRGLDVESAIWIWSLLKERCKQGTSIIFISADLDEILQYSDRILVFFAGQVSKPLDATETTVEQLGELIGGIGWSEEGLIN